MIRHFGVFTYSHVAHMLFLAGKPPRGVGMKTEKVILNGCRIEQRRNKETKQDEPYYVADLYWPGVGGYDAPINEDQYRSMVSLPAGTPFLQHMTLSIDSEVRTTKTGFNYAVRRPAVKFAHIELAQGQQAKAS